MGSLFSLLKSLVWGASVVPKDRQTRTQQIQTERCERLSEERGEPYCIIELAPGLFRNIAVRRLLDDPSIGYIRIVYNSATGYNWES